MTGFATVIELVIRFFFMLVIIYVVADNPDSPKSIAIVCAITSNPLLFLQISYPNKVSNVLDSLCSSGPVLYFALWVYYIHTHIRFSNDNKSNLLLGFKLALGIVLFFVNMLRLLHFHVLVV
jgi:hypothetical protein